MKKQLFDNFNPIEFYKKHRNSLGMEIGLKLSSGLNLASTLKSVAPEACSKSEEKALLAASDRLKQGESPQNVLKEKRINLNARDRYVLSLPIDDKQKGNILKGWLINSKLRERHGCSYKTIGFAISIIGVVSVALFTFVFPMFHEIALGQNVRPDGFLNSLGECFRFLYLSKMFILVPMLLLGILGFVIFLGKLVFNSKIMDEEADIISMVASSDYENQWNNIAMVSNKICFPTIYKKLDKLVNAINSGVETETCIADAKLSPMLTWFLQLSVHNREDRSFLAEGSQMMKQSADYMNNQQVRIFEILLVILESLIVFMFLYYVFGMMEVLKIGILD